MTTAQSGNPIVRYFADVTRALNTYGGGANGGFLLDTELFQSVWDKARAIDGPLARCLFLTTNKHEAEWPALDETSRVAGSRFGGIKVRWQGTTDDKSATPDASQPAAAMIKFVPKRAMVFSTPFSNDLLADAPLVERMLDYAASQEIQYAVVESMINGKGITHPLGVIAANSSIQVTRNGSNNIAQADVDTMWSRLWPYCRRNAAWMCNDDTLLKLDAVATTTGWPANLYMPMGMYGNPYPLLKGRPLLPVEQCPALGTQGDLIVGDWSQYALVARTVDNNGDPDMSVTCGSLGEFVETRSADEFMFDTDSTVFRFKFRVDGSPLWRQPVTIADGSQTAGPFVVLK
ncbi:MAG: phage major capsid protein [Candidatus Pacebacteria bacterium]|nr:phage major capsid protein [Candidatus Paceibacterota bacterium]